MAVCTTCGSSVPEGNTQCPKCGSIFIAYHHEQNKKQIKVCNLCKKENDRDALFCKHCGAKIIEKNESNSDKTSYKVFIKKADGNYSLFGLLTPEDRCIYDNEGNVVLHEDNGRLLRDNRDGDNYIIDKSGKIISESQRYGYIESYDNFLETCKNPSKVCMKCGKNNDDDALYCKCCGTRITKGEYRVFRINSDHTCTAIGVFAPDDKFVYGMDGTTVKFKYEDGYFINVNTEPSKQQKIYKIDENGYIFNEPTEMGYIDDYSEYVQNYQSTLNDNSAEKPDKSMSESDALNTSLFSSKSSRWGVGLGVGLLVIIIVLAIKGYDYTNRKSQYPRPDSPETERIATTTSAYVITTVKEDYDNNNSSYYNNSYSINDVEQLDGLFLLSSDEKWLTPLNNEMIGDLFDKPSGMRIDLYKNVTGQWYSGENAYYDGTWTEGSWYVFSDTRLIQVKSGEKIVLVGTEGKGKENAVIYARQCSLIGYCNTGYISGSFGMDSFSSINGIDISGIHNNSYKYNEALAGTNLKLLSSGTNYTLVSKKCNDTVSLGYYNGTQYNVVDIPMSEPYYSIDSHPNEPRNFAEYCDVLIPIVTTTNGYFYLDTSSLPKGLYVIQSRSGKYLIEIV